MNEEIDRQAKYNEVLKLIADAFTDPSFLDLVCHSSLEDLAQRAALFEDRNSPADVRVLVALAYLFSYRLNDPEGVLGHRGAFSKVGEVLQGSSLAAVSSDAFLAIYRAAFEYLRVSASGEVFVVDDSGAVFVLDSADAFLLPVWDPPAMQSISETSLASRELAFNVMRSLAALDSEAGYLMGLYAEAFGNE